MAFAELGNVGLYYEIEGDAGLPVLVLAHSLGVNLHMWDAQVEALAKHVRLVRYDARGQGKSSVPKGPYSVEQMGDDVLGLLDALGVEKAWFCGLSMGGSVGQWLGIHASDRIEKLVLASTAAKIGTAETWNARIAQTEREGLEPMIPATMERWFTAGFRTAHAEQVDAIAAMIRTTKLEGYLATCAMVRDADFRDELGTIRVSTLVISGSSDASTTPAHGRALADGIAGAKFVEVPGAHLCSVESADAFSAAVGEFFNA